MSLLLFNGQTGGLGRYMEPVLNENKIRHHSITSRLEDQKGFTKELDSMPFNKEDKITFVILAAMVSVKKCETYPLQAHKTNVEDTVKTAESFLRWAMSFKRHPQIFYISTGHVYAPKTVGQKTSESDSVAPRSVYAKTKLEAENQLQSLVKKYPGSRMKIGRVFGLLSIYQSLDFVLPALTDRVKHRNFEGIVGLGCVRDYLDARDVCRHLARIGGLDWSVDPLVKWDIINICSGEPVPIQRIFDGILEEAGLSRDAISKTITQGTSRPDDVPWIVGEPSRLRQISQPLQLIPITQTIREIYNLR